MKLSSLRGAEKLPKKRFIKESSAVYMPFEDEGYNKAISEYESLEVSGNVGQLAHVIEKYMKTYVPNAGSHVESDLGKNIIQNLDKWLVIKREA